MYASGGAAVGPVGAAFPGVVVDGGASSKGGVGALRQGLGGISAGKGALLGFSIQAWPIDPVTLPRMHSHQPAGAQQAGGGQARGTGKAGSAGAPAGDRGKAALAGGAGALRCMGWAPAGGYSMWAPRLWAGQGRGCASVPQRSPGKRESVWRVGRSRACPRAAGCPSICGPWRWAASECHGVPAAPSCPDKTAPRGCSPPPPPF